MKELSERVQREFNAWKEKYEIPYNMEFQVKTLLKLQEEYDEVEIGSNTTRTRETLLHMIDEAQRHLYIKEKPSPNKIMYIDVLVAERTKPLKIVIYHENNMTILHYDNFSMKDYASFIVNMIGKDEIATIYIDTTSLGRALYDELIDVKGIELRELKLNRPFRV